MSSFVNAVNEGSQLEQRAIQSDRAGRVHEAMDLYLQAVDCLNGSLSLASPGHPDASAIERHVGEIQNRVSYLSSLSINSRPLIPLESHIHPVQLTIAPTASSPQSHTLSTAAVVGGVSGLILLGPLGLVAGSVGAAYATTRDDQIGSAVRGVARGSLTVVERVGEFGREHGISDKAKQFGSAVATKASEIDREYDVTGKVKSAAVGMGKRLSDFNQEHKVTDKIASGISTGFASLSNLLSSGSQSQTTNNYR
jgi:hypothetical protein